MAAQYDADGNLVIHDLGLRSFGRRVLTAELADVAEAYLDEHTDDNAVPTIAGLCKRLKVSTQALYKWIEQKPVLADEKDYQKVIDVIEQIRTNSEDGLIKGALDGSYNAGFAKFLLAAKHGYKEQSESGGNIQVNVSRDSVEISHKNQTLTVKSDD